MRDLGDTAKFKLTVKFKKDGVSNMLGAQLFTSNNNCLDF